MFHTITTAVAGTGFIGPVHLEALRRLGVRVKGILGSSPEKSTAAAQSLGLELGYATFADILADEEVQVVHLAVPNVLHYEMCKQALAAGKHVMCEKPLAMTSAETAELVELAAASGLVCGVTYNIRFYPLNLETRTRIAEAGKRIYSVTGSYQQDWLLYDTDYNWRVLAEAGGKLRAVADIGTHWIDLVTFITGLEVEAVFADLMTVHPIRHRPQGEIATFTGEAAQAADRIPVDIDTEDGGSILFRFKGGARGQLWVSQVSAGRKNCLQYDIATADAAYVWNSERPNELRIGSREAPNAILLKDPGLVGGQARSFTNYPGGHNEGFPDTFKQCFRSFYSTILSTSAGSEREGSPPLFASFTDGHQEVLLCEAILRSQREQRWVYLNSQK
ncbi:MAG: Gfo/Idh/MocA family oxidoreductase [Bacteroidota bacterium]